MTMDLLTDRRSVRLAADEFGRGGSRRPRALLLTALACERDAVVRHIAGCRPLALSGPMTVEIGQFDSGAGPWMVFVGEMGRSNIVAANLTSSAISAIRPRVVLMVGIAGGRREVRRGDVVAAEKVYYYESGKEELRVVIPLPLPGRYRGALLRFRSRKVFLPSPIVYNASGNLVREARRALHDQEWRSSIIDLEVGQQPTAYIGPVASGGVVVKARGRAE